MATGKASDFKVYDDLVIGSAIETITQQINAFNAASRNGIRLTTVRRRGDYERESFFKAITLVTRRDPTSVAAVADTPLTQDENIRVKINRRIGPIAQTLDSFRKIMLNADIDSVSSVLGNEVGTQQIQDMLNTSLLAGRAGIVANTPLLYTVPANGTLTTAGLVNALALMGDRADRIVVWVMHSKMFYNLISEQIALNITGVSNFNIANAMPITLNRPVLVTDAPGLKVAGASPALDTYYALGLTENGIVVEDSEQQTFFSDMITGNESLFVRFQGESAFNLGLKGMKWDTVNGGVNPTDAAVGTGSNWDKVATSNKDLAGVAIASR